VAQNSDCKLKAEYLKWFEVDCSLGYFALADLRRDGQLNHAILHLQAQASGRVWS
jgi:hypothetical protein